MPSVNRGGNCPYCGGICTKVRERTPLQDLLQCNQCNLWAVRLNRTGAVYPLQNGSDPDTPPTVSIP